MRGILNVLLFLPLLSAGTVLMLLAFYLLWLGLLGLMGWLLHLSTIWVPQSAWTFWRAFDPVVIWQHGLQVSRPLLLGFQVTTIFMDHLFFGMASLASIFGWTFIAWHLVSCWLGVSVAGWVGLYRFIRGQRDVIQPTAILALVDLFVVGLLMSIGMPLFLDMPQPENLIGHMAATMSVLVLAMLIYALSRFIWSSFDSSVDSPRMLED